MVLPLTLPFPKAAKQRLSFTYKAEGRPASHVVAPHVLPTSAAPIF